MNVCHTGKDDHVQGRTDIIMIMVMMMMMMMMMMVVIDF
jgi:hypothetical protein